MFASFAFFIRNYSKKRNRDTPIALKVFAGSIDYIAAYLTWLFDTNLNRALCQKNLQES